MARFGDDTCDCGEKGFYEADHAVAVAIEPSAREVLMVNQGQTIRPLSSYRPQHDQDCTAWLKGRYDRVLEIFVPEGSCSCGLDAALQREVTACQEKKKEPHGAELAAAPTIPDVAATETASVVPLKLWCDVERAYGDFRRTVYDRASYLDGDEAIEAADRRFWDAWNALIKEPLAAHKSATGGAVHDAVIDELKRLRPHVEKWRTGDGREVRSRLANDLLSLIDARIDAISQSARVTP